MADKSPKKTAPKKKSSSTPKRSSSNSVKAYSSNKPLFGLGTIIALIVLAAIIAFTVYLNRKQVMDAAAATPTAGSSYVFTEADGTPSSIKVEPVVGNSVELQRDDKNVWVLTLPIKTEADQGLAEAASSQLTAINIVNSEIKGSADVFGLDKPAYVIIVKFADDKTHTLEVGDSTPTNSGYYVRLDNGKMMIVSLSAIDALTQLAFFPPYLNTPTPTTLPSTETPVPVSPPEVTVTPTP